MQWISKPRLAWPINTEVGSLEFEFLGGVQGEQHEFIRFQRYDAMLDPHPDAAKFGPVVTAEQRERLRDFMDPNILDEAYILARECAAVQVRLEDLKV